MTYDERSHAQALEFLSTRESNARTYARTFDRMIARASGAEVWDVEGKRYLDCLGCAGALPLGHNPPVVMDRVQEFLSSGHPLQALDIPTPAKHRFVEQLLASLPEPFARDARLQFCGPSGSDAVEAALKLFKTATGRRSVFVFQGGYHGMTAGSLALMGNTAPKQAISGFAPEVHFFPYPDRRRCALGIGGDQGEMATLNLLENALADPESGMTKPALVLLEVVQGEAGCIPAPAAWLQRLRAITQRHDVPLVIDEVQTGVGRTGTMFAFEQAGIVPDAIVLSKAVGGGFPLAVLAYQARHDRWQPGAHAGTFRGNQIALVAGAATLEHVREQALPARAARMGALLIDGLRDLASRFDCIGEVRGRGLMVGAEIVHLGRAAGTAHADLDGSLARSIKRACFENGLILETGGRHGAVLRWLPPLVITQSQLDEALHKLQRALASVVHGPVSAMEAA